MPEAGFHPERTRYGYGGDKVGHWSAGMLLVRAE
jgi:hypothetical protein